MDKFQVGDKVVFARALDGVDDDLIGRTGVVVEALHLDPEPDTPPAYAVRMDHQEEWDDEWLVAEWCLDAVEAEQ